MTGPIYVLIVIDSSSTVHTVLLCAVLTIHETDKGPAGSSALSETSRE